MRTMLLIAALCGALAPCGCSTRNWLPIRPGPMAVGPDATQEQVVALVNRNITGNEGQGGLMGWRAMNAKFHMSPLPMGIPGQVVVEAPQNFRIRVSHPIGGGDELDVGSNTDQFWLWQKNDAVPYLLTARHEDMPIAMQSFRIPFQPDWVMEVFGVIPIDGSKYRLDQDPRNGYVDLVADTHSTAGVPVRKIVRIDRRRGWINEHIIQSPTGDLIASAQLQDYEATPQSGILLPKTIRINWPEHDLELTVRLGEVLINPPQLPEMAWQIPRKDGYRVLDMGEYARSQAGNPTGLQQAGHLQPTGALPGPQSQVVPAINTDPFAAAVPPAGFATNSTPGGVGQTAALDPHPTSPGAAAPFPGEAGLSAGATSAAAPAVPWQVTGYNEPQAGPRPADGAANAAAPYVGDPWAAQPPANAAASAAAARQQPLAPTGRVRLDTLGP
ncbi:MAG: hypothetical protein R3B90_01170 [Planctomycetaceae bacterium]